MNGGSSSNPAIRDRIATALRDIEREHKVAILLAIESGSRAWGFPSCDSDWDVRFIYVRPMNAYLRVEPLPDVIEVPVTDELDLNGWDLRKALALLVGSNAVVLEWLASPIVYRQNEKAYATLAKLALSAAHIPALTYHYDRLARRHWVPTAEAPVRLKTLFYALRAALALAWLRDTGRPPPMDLEGLIAGLKLPSAFLEAVEQLKFAKLAATEANTIDAPDEICRFLNATLRATAPRVKAWDKVQVLASADQAFFEIVTNYKAYSGRSYEPL